MMSNNSKVLFVLTIICGLLLFGCLGSNQQTQNPAPAAGPGPTPVNNAPAPSPGVNPSPNPAPEPTPTVNPSSPTPNPTPTQPQNFAGMSYTQLVGLGVPLECNIRSTYSGRTTNIHVFINGNRQVRSEIGTMEGSRCSFVGVLKDNKMYLGCSSGSYIQGCDWMELDVDPSMLNSTTTSQTGSVNSMQYGNIPPADIQCNPWILDTSKFDTPGHVCNMNDLGAGGAGAYGQTQ